MDKIDKQSNGNRELVLPCYDWGHDFELQCQKHLLKKDESPSEISSRLLLVIIVQTVQ